MAESPKTSKVRAELDDLEVSQEESEQVTGGAVSQEGSDRLGTKAGVKGVQPPLNSSLL